MTAERKVDTIDQSVQAAHRWINDLTDHLKWHDRHRSFRLLRATLHALRDWLQVDEAVQLGAQLPTLIRGVYYEGWRPAVTPAKPRKREDFLDRVSDEMSPDLVEDLEDKIAGVFAFLSRHVSSGEIADVRKSLPADLRKIWP